MPERRIDIRTPVLTPIWLNKHVGGFPYLAELVDVSPDGMRIRTTLEPDTDVASFSLEFGIPGLDKQVWLWARRVRREGKFEGLQLLGTELFDRACLAQLVRLHSLSRMPC